MNVLRQLSMLVLLFFSPAALTFPYATSVVDSYNPHSSPNTNPDDALGPPDGRTESGLLKGVYSMGAFGWIELELGSPVFDIPGYDLGVWEEITYSPDPAVWPLLFPDEDVNVYLGFDLTNWILVGQAQRGVPGSLVYDISGLGVSGAQYIRIEDVSGKHFPEYDGFDLDAVTIFSDSAPVPTPSTWILVLPGLIFLALGKIKTGQRRVQRFRYAGSANRSGYN